MKRSHPAARHAAALLAIAGLAPFASAHAVAVACSTSISASVVGAEQCQVSTTANQDFLNRDPIVVNAEKFFFGEQPSAADDWSFIGKIGEAAGLAGDASGLSGAWNIGANTNVGGYGDLMLIFKDGNDTFLTGYLLTDGVLSGTWTSPFPGRNGNYKQVSHISVYGRGTADQGGGGSDNGGGGSNHGSEGGNQGGDGGNQGEVPVPGTLALLGAACVGLGTLRRKARTA